MSAGVCDYPGGESSFCAINFLYVIFLVILVLCLGWNVRLFA